MTKQQVNDLNAAVRQSNIWLHRVPRKFCDLSLHMQLLFMSIMFNLLWCCVKNFGSCVLKAPAVECRSIPAIDTRPTYRSSVVDTRSTCRSSVDRQSIDMSIDSWSTLDRQGSIVGRVATDSCVGRQHPYRDGQSADRLSTLCRYSTDARLTFIRFQPLYLFILIVNYCISQLQTSSCRSVL